MRKVTSKKIFTGVLIFFFLSIFGAIHDLIVNIWLFNGFTIVFLIMLILLNNTLCKHFICIDKLDTYNYSWKQFGIISVISISTFAIMEESQESVILQGLISAGSFSVSAFLVYLSFYLSNRYIKKRFLRISVKSIPFLLLFTAFLYVHKDYFIDCLPSPKVKYMNVTSGEIFEVDTRDMKKERKFLGEFVKARQEELDYAKTIEEYESKRINYDTFIKKTTKHEDAFYTYMKNAMGFAREIKSRIFLNMCIDLNNIEYSDFFALKRFKEGIETVDSMAIRTGNKLMEDNRPRRIEYIRKYSSILKVGPDVRQDELRATGLLFYEVTRILSLLDEYDAALGEHQHGDITDQGFAGKVSSYDSTLKVCFSRCDSLMKHIKNPEELGVIKDYANYDNIYGSILYERFESFNSLLDSYINYDQIKYESTYKEYAELYEKTNTMTNDYLLDILQK